MSRVVFLGTPEAAVPTLALLQRRLDVQLVVTQPDKPRGRSAKPAPSPVKVFAESASIRVVQPLTQRELADVLRAVSPVDVGVVVGYGRILNSQILSMPRRGFLNIHFSLLPRWRGAAPVARALMAGDSMTGVTIIRLDEGMDTGGVLTAQAVDIGADENAGELTSRLARLGADLVASVLPGYIAGDLEPVAQTGEGATLAPKITSSDRPLAVEWAPDRFINTVRGLAPTPGATLVLDDSTHKILEVRPHPATPAPGTWMSSEGLPVVAVGGAGVELVQLQPPGRRLMTGADWLRGRRVTSGRAS